MTLFQDVPIVKKIVPDLLGLKTPQLAASAATTPPPVEKPTVMPTPDDEAVALAKRRSISAQMQRRGRASTILSDLATSSDKLGA